MPDLVATEVLFYPHGQITTIFDWQPIPVFGFPFWIIISFFLFFCWLIVIHYWRKRNKKLNPIKGWLISLKKMTQTDAQVWIISRLQKLTIECLAIKDNILSYDTDKNISMWHVNSAMGSIRVGGRNPAVICSEDYDQNRDPLTEIALCHACDTANATMDKLATQLNEAYQKAMKAGEITTAVMNPAEIAKPIENAESYERTGKELLKQLNPNGIEINAFSVFQPNRFLKYFPRGCSAMWFGGELTRDAEGLNDDKDIKGFIEKNIILIVAVVFAGLAIGAGYYIQIGG